MFLSLRDAQSLIVFRVAIKNTTRNDVIQMMHTIECAQNAIQCAYENIRDDKSISNELRNTILNANNSRSIYNIASSYIDDKMIDCECEYAYATIIENELRDLYRNSHFLNFQIKCYYIKSIDLYHVAYSMTYDDNSIAFESMIVRFEYFKSTMSTFHNFEMINEIDIY